MSKKRTLYKNEKFGKLSVLETTDNKYINCICECGREISVLKYNLTSGKSKTCGKGSCQSHFVDITEFQFGFLTVKELVGSDGDHGSVWRCLCICGNECNVRGNSLRRGRTKSCGCKSAELNSVAISKDPGTSNINQLYAVYKNGAKLRSYSWNLSKEEFAEAIKRNCFYCGIEPYQKMIISNIMGDRILLYNGIDRLDNTKGYSINNIATACGICNIAKRDLSFNEFIKWIDRVSKHLSERKII